ncbi:hypothetical protein [Paenibacillus sp. An7]|uniref:hypothetical protein n=1 Tax=Paenibacillus sp. An7 TaxID=2689577 RepID=UPI00135BB6DC|nr:hypothetical protein [Paenibacillus sp. An7]
MIICNAAELLGFEQDILTSKPSQSSTAHMFISNELPLEQNRSKVFLFLSGIARSGF